MEHVGFHTASDGTEIWYGTVGQGPAMVLCDGFACDGFIWPYVIDRFHEHFRIVRFHYRGHGQSSRPVDPGRVAVEDLCGDLRGVLDDLSIEHAIFAGHSMGVQVILQFYGLYPELVDALIPMCGTYKRPLDTFHDSDRLATLLPYIDRAVELAPEQLQSMWKKLLPSRFSMLASRAELNPRLVRSADFLPYLEHVSRMDLRVFVRMLSELADHTAEDILPTIDIPMLIIAGERDTFTPRYRSEEMEAAVASAELLVLPNTTHAAPLELPDMVEDAVERFLRAHDLWAGDGDEVRPPAETAVDP